MCTPQSQARVDRPFHLFREQLKQWPICGGGPWPPLRLWAPQDPWQRRKARPEDSRTAPPGPGPACLADDQRDRALRLGSQILISALPAGLLGSPALGRDARSPLPFPSSGGLGH